MKRFGLVAAAVAVAALAISTTGCLQPSAVPPEPDTVPFPNELLDCQQGTQQLVALYESKGIATAPVECRKSLSSIPGGEYYWGNENRVVIYYGAVDLPVSVYFKFASHELGHAWDNNRLDATKRAEFASLRGEPTWAWSKTEGCGSTTCEDYANVFSIVEAGVPANQWGHTAAPTPDQLAQLCAAAVLPC